MEEPPQEAGLVFCSPIIRWVSAFVKNLLPGSPPGNVPCTHSVRGCGYSLSQKAGDGANILDASNDPDTPIPVRLATLFSLFPFDLTQSSALDGEEGAQTVRAGPVSDATLDSDDRDDQVVRVRFERALLDYLHGLLNTIFYGGLYLPNVSEHTETILHPASITQTDPPAEFQNVGVTHTVGRSLPQNKVIDATIFVYCFLSFALQKDGPFDPNPTTTDFSNEPPELDLLSVSSYWSSPARRLLKCISLWALFFDSEKKRVASLPVQERSKAWDRFVREGRLDHARGPILQHFDDAINALDRSKATLS